MYAIVPKHVALMKIPQSKIYNGMQWLHQLLDFSQRAQGIFQALKLFPYSTVLTHPRLALMRTYCATIVQWSGF